jgi:hypothetical protein
MRSLLLRLVLLGLLAGFPLGCGKEAKNTSGVTGNPLTAPKLERPPGPPPRPD